MSESPPIKDIHAISTSLSVPAVVPRQNVDNERKGVLIKDVVNESTLYNSVRPQKYPLLDNERESAPTEPTPCLISFSNVGSTTENMTERLEKSLSLNKGKYLVYSIFSSFVTILVHFEKGFELCSLILDDEMPCSTTETGRVKYVRGGILSYATLYITSSMF
jgi:hypothetical protein